MIAREINGARGTRRKGARTCAAPYAKGFANIWWLAARASTSWRAGFVWPWSIVRGIYFEVEACLLSPILESARAR
jgi:hypothetical protein